MQIRCNFCLLRSRSIFPLMASSIPSAIRAFYQKFSNMQCNSQVWIVCHIFCSPVSLSYLLDTADTGWCLLFIGVASAAMGKLLWEIERQNLPSPRQSCVLHYCHAITACGIAFESYQRKNWATGEARKNRWREAITAKMGSWLDGQHLLQSELWRKVTYLSSISVVECFSIVMLRRSTRIVSAINTSSRVPIFLCVFQWGVSFIAKYWQQSAANWGSQTFTPIPPANLLSYLGHLWAAIVVGELSSLSQCLYWGPQLSVVIETFLAR